MNPLPLELPSSIRQHLDLIQQHPRVLKVSVPCWREDEQCFAVIAEFEIQLPSRRRMVGVSGAGVRAVEPVTLVFPPSYPLHAPRIYLRDDFPRTFAHIQPGQPDTPPVPCILDGDPDELFHAQGLWSILNQLADWLGKAALDRLIDPAQGWEPVRRDNLEDSVMADLGFLRAQCSRQPQHYFFFFEYLKFLKTENNRPQTKSTLLTGKISDQKVQLTPTRPEALQQCFSRNSRQEAWDGKSIAILATPGKDRSGKPYIASQYEAETVTNIQSLYIQAEKYGCRKSLDSAFSWLKRCAKKLSSDFSVPIVIILGVRRPFTLIGEFSNIELVPYWMEIRFPEIFSDEKGTPVFPMGLQQAISENLLRSFSNELEPLEAKSIALVGCGSLGAKIAIHLARAGHAPGTVIDKGYLSPHNAARHALLPEMGVMQLDWMRPKANVIASAINSLDQHTKDFQADVSQIGHDRDLRKKLFPKKVKIIINATASITVREALAQISTQEIKARVIETALFSEGHVGLMSLEGPDRNPKTLDLLAFAYQLMHDDDEIRALVLQQPEAAQYNTHGQGCGSLTMRMSDARISQFAASMTQGITALIREKSAHDTGLLFLGKLGVDGISLGWQRHTVAPVQIVPMDNNADWHIRVSDRAHQKILAEYSKFPTVETGGILLGRASQNWQSFLVTDVLSAPLDSKRMPEKFILGVEGIQEAVAEYIAATNNTLYCLGTWHSHLSLGGPSTEDYKTAAILAKSQAMMSAMLIYTPDGYKGILAERSVIQ
jgi:hypothetical protein